MHYICKQREDRFVDMCCNCHPHDECTGVQTEISETHCGETIIPDVEI